MLDETTKFRAESGAGQDHWHDEGFKLGIGQEKMWDRRYLDLKAILNNCIVQTPVDQDERVLLGSGVLLVTEDGEERYYILEGYYVGKEKNRATIGSPLGQAVLGKEIGDEVGYVVEGRRMSFEISAIIKPSEAASWRRE